MSWQATTAVTRGSSHKGSELLCLLMMANYAGVDGSGIYPSIKTLAHDCRMSERAVRYIIAKLVKSGELMEEGVFKNNVKRWRINTDVLEQQALQRLQGQKISSPAIAVAEQALQNEPILPSSPAIAVAGKYPVQEQPSKNQLSEEGLKFADWFRKLLPENIHLGRDYRAQWAKCYDDMIRLDGRAKEQIVFVAQWARRDSFWASNFLSPMKLRSRNKDKVMYFDVFLERAKTDRAINGHAKKEGQYGLDSGDKPKITIMQ